MSVGIIRSSEPGLTSPSYVPPKGEPLSSSVVRSSWRIDLCSKYGCEPGKDITTALQRAINDAAESTVDTELYFSTPGVYHLEGPQKTGTAFGYNYSGQVLFPARASSAGSRTITLTGAASPPPAWTSAEPLHTQCAILLSNAISGNVFDAIPGFEYSGFAFTDLRVFWRDLAVRVPNNPQCGGINGKVLLAMDAERLLLAPSCTFTELSYPEHGTAGLVLPQINHVDVTDLKKAHITGFGVGLVTSELASIEASVQSCAVGVRCEGSTGHLVNFKNLFIGACPVGIQAHNEGFGGGVLTGRVTVEVSTGGAWAFSRMVDDPGSKLKGLLDLLCTTNPTGGYAVNGTLNLTIRNLGNGSSNPQDQPPFDSFTRVVDTSVLGTCDVTNHPWSLQGGEIKTAGGVAQAAVAALSFATVPFSDRVATRTQRIDATITTGPAAYNFGVLLMRNFANGKSLWAHVSSIGNNKAYLTKVDGETDHDLATSAENVVKPATTYTLTTVLERPASGVWKALVYVNGTQVINYTLTAEDKEAFTDLATITQFAPGVMWKEDVESTISDFKVTPGA